LTVASTAARLRPVRGEADRDRLFAVIPLPVLSTAQEKRQREVHQIARLPDLQSA
jgi:hypothetical protein